MTFRLNGSLAMAGLCCVLAQSAHAEAQGSVQFGNFQFTLTDLNPNDGIAPSITFGDGVLRQMMDADLSDGLGWGGAPNTLSPVSKSQSVTVKSGSVASQTLSTPDYGVSFGGEGQAAGFHLQQGGVFNLDSDYALPFQLSAGTALTVTASASGQLAVDVPAWSVDRTTYPRNGYFDWAPLQVTGSAVLYVGQLDLGGLPVTSFSCRKGCQVSDDLVLGTRTYDTTSISKTKTLSINFANATDAPVSPSLGLHVSLDGYATAPLPIVSVPEASSALMMLLGLGGVMAIGRGRLLPRV
jgi:hypothetical protein